MIRLGLLVATALYAALILLRAPTLSPDSHTYVNCATELRSLGYSLNAYLEGATCLRRPLTTLLPVGIIAALQAIIGEQWVRGFVVLNLGFVAASVFIFVRICMHLSIGFGWIVFGCLALATSADWLTWPRFVLTDTLYSAQLLAAVALSLALTSPGARTRALTMNGMAFFVICLLMAITRPTALFTLLPLSIFFILNWIKPKITACELLSFLLIALVTMAIAYGLMFDGYLTTAQDNLSLYTRLMERTRQGVVATARPEVAIGVCFDGWCAAKLFFLRLVHFFNPYAATYSTLHNLMNTGLLTLAFAGTIMWIRVNWQEVPDIQQFNAGSLCMLIIVSSASLHSVSILDFDWRYRYPMLAPWFIVALLGFYNWRRLKPCKQG